MIEVFFNGRPIDKAPLFIFKRGSAYLNFLRRIMVGSFGKPLLEYVSLFNAHRIAGGLCVILVNKYIWTFAPWPRMIKDD